MTIYKEITCKSACNRIAEGRLPYRWDLNAYRGCGHRCQYCFALYSHKYMGSEDYFNEIFVKTNMAEALERQLSSRRWDRSVINLGGVTDSYQPAEETYKLMPDILRLLIKYRTPALISTKSDLILRDFDLILELNRVAGINVASTITAVDEPVRMLIEPGGASSFQRFAMLEKFAKAGVDTGVHFMPIIPYITDSWENMEAIFAKGHDVGCAYIICSPLNLRGATRKMFFQFVKEVFPREAIEIAKLYKTSWLDNPYREELQRRVRALKQKYVFAGKRAVPKREEKTEHLSLF